MKTAAHDLPPLAQQLNLAPEAIALLDYLQHGLPGYPFDAPVDRPFVEELLDDFPQLDLLEEIKILRWYHNDQPFQDQQHPRASLRRWIARARKRTRG